VFQLFSLLRDGKDRKIISTGNIFVELFCAFMRNLKDLGRNFDKKFYECKFIEKFVAEPVSGVLDTHPKVGYSS
jgi:hypothetical protein